jgi:hypothetical protein
MGKPAFELIHHGGPVRTKLEYPYSYDPIRHYSEWVGGERSSAYDDRMEGWDRVKFQTCVEQMRREISDRYGNMRGYSDARWTRDFLRLYWDAPRLEVTDIVETCNVGNGFACWYFEWVAEPNLDAVPPTPMQEYEEARKRGAFDSYTYIGKDGAIRSKY